MQVSSQRHLASARGSSLLTWLPRPGRGAKSPPALCCRPTPVSRSRLGGDVFDPPRLGIFVAYGSNVLCGWAHAEGLGVGLPGKDLGQQQGTVSTRGGDNGPLFAK